MTPPRARLAQWLAPYATRVVRDEYRRMRTRRDLAVRIVLRLARTNRDLRARVAALEDELAATTVALGQARREKGEALAALEHLHDDRQVAA